MRFEPTPLAGSFVLELEQLEDHRGFYARGWCRDEFAAQGITTAPVQLNFQLSHAARTLRGMHYQVEPFEEAKLVRVMRGAIFDAIVDLRSGSPTYSQSFGVELSAENRRMLYVPGGFAHGYMTLVDDTEVFYQVSEFYSPEHERGVRWNDATFGISWPFTDELVISEKDRNWADFTP